MRRSQRVLFFLVGFYGFAPCARQRIIPARLELRGFTFSLSTCSFSKSSFSNVQLSFCIPRLSRFLGFVFLPLRTLALQLLALYLSASHALSLSNFAGSFVESLSSRAPVNNKSKNPISKAQLGKPRTLFVNHILLAGPLVAG